MPPPVSEYVACRGAADAAKRILDWCENATRCRPPSCPWRAFSDPTVATVLREYRACSTGNGPTPALLRASNPPRYVYQGLLHYAAARNAVEWQARQDEQRKQKR